MKSILLCLLAFVSACGTSHLKVAPVTVQPIHLTIDVNVHDDPAETPNP